MRGYDNNDYLETLVEYITEIKDLSGNKVMTDKEISRSIYYLAEAAEILLRELQNRNHKIKERNL